MAYKRRKALLILGELNNSDLDWMLQVGRKERLESDRVLIYEKEPVNALYFVLNGKFSIWIGDRELAQISMGEVVGEISFLDDRPPLATVKSLENSLVLGIPRWQLLNQLQRDEHFAARFYRGLAKCLSDRMRDTVRRLGYGLEFAELYRENNEYDRLEVERLELAEAKFEWLRQHSRG